MSIKWDARDVLGSDSELSREVSPLLPALFCPSPLPQEDHTERRWREHIGVEYDLGLDEQERVRERVVGAQEEARRGLFTPLGGAGGGGGPVHGPYLGLKEGGPRGGARPRLAWPSTPPLLPLEGEPPLLQGLRAEGLHLARDHLRLAFEVPPTFPTQPPNPQSAFDRCRQCGSMRRCSRRS